LLMLGSCVCPSLLMTLAAAAAAPHRESLYIHLG
jgi:hypothetical protein